MVGPFTYIQIVMPIVGTVLYPVIPVINVTEIRTHRSSFLNAHILDALLLECLAYSKGSLILHWPLLIFFPLSNKEPVVPVITGQIAQYYLTSILKWFHSRNSLSLLSGVIAIFLNITLFGISWSSR